MIVQIYSLMDEKEAQECVRLGADHIGVLVSRELDGRYPCETLPEKARSIFQAIGGTCRKVLISVDETPDQILEMCAYLHPDILHLCAEYHGSPAFRARLNQECPGTKLMEAVGVQDRSAIQDAKIKAEYSDILILDSVAKDVPGVGAAGVTHDWSIDKEIIDTIPLPVIEAGGLGPDNVAEAIHELHPWGVDSLTETSRKKNGIIVGKDLDAVKRFVKAVRGACV